MTTLVETLNDAGDWRELAEITLCSILVFNARRGSEAAELTLKNFSERSNSVDSLTEVEKQLLSKSTVINIISRAIHKVDIALDILCVSSTGTGRFLLPKCGVLAENEFVFALPRTKKSHLSFYGTLRRVAHRAGLQKPHLLTTTRRRKQAGGHNGAGTLAYN